MLDVGMHGVSVAFSSSLAYAAIITAFGALTRDGQRGVLLSSALASAAM